MDKLKIYSSTQQLKDKKIGNKKKSFIPQKYKKIVWTKGPL